MAAIEQLLRDRPATTVTVVASGPLVPTARARLGGRALFVEPRRHRDMPQLLASHRVALGQFRLGILSQFELEAMACGTPIVATFRYPAAYDTPPPSRRPPSPTGSLERLRDSSTMTSGGRGSPVTVANGWLPTTPATPWPLISTGCIDARCRADRPVTYVRAAVAIHEGTGADMVDGPVRALGDGLVAEAIARRRGRSPGRGHRRARAC